MEESGVGMILMGSSSNERDAFEKALESIQPVNLPELAEPPD